MQIAKAFIAKCWKTEDAELAPGTRWIDEKISVQVDDTVQRLDDLHANCQYPADSNIDLLCRSPQPRTSQDDCSAEGSAI